MAEVIIVENPSAGAEIAAQAIIRLAHRTPDAVLGVATGSTPLAVYARLAQAAAAGELDAARLRAFAHDEYVGLPAEHPESYHSVIRREVIEQIGLDPSRVHVPSGDLATITHAGADYERLIAEAGGVDLQLLGIGVNGHIGFNEPGSSLASRTRIKTLAQQTRADNARFFSSADEVPVHCITQGIGTILDARHLVLLAFGASKADAVAGAVEGPVSANNPGSAIQMHPHVTVIVDEAAATGLAHADYYRHAWANQPEWLEL